MLFADIWYDVAQGSDWRQAYACADNTTQKYANIVGLKITVRENNFQSPLVTRRPYFPIHGDLYCNVFWK